MRDLDEFFNDTLELLVNGTTYVVPSPDAKTGLWCLRLSEAAETGTVVLDDDRELGMYQRVLGPVWGQMVEDGVSLPRIAFAGQTAFVWITQGPVAAEIFWDTLGKGPSPNRETRRSTSTAAAGATNGRASTNGTKSRATKATASPAKRARSRGATS